MPGKRALGVNSSEDGRTGSLLGAASDLSADFSQIKMEYIMAPVPGMLAPENFYSHQGPCGRHLGDGLFYSRGL